MVAIIKEPTLHQYASESGHWYDVKTGNQITFPRGTHAKTILAKGGVPGVTSITKQVHKEAIQRWMVNRAVKFSASIFRDTPDDSMYMLDDETLLSEVWELLNADSEAITGRGKELHGAIELAAQGGVFDTKWKKHVTAVMDACHDHGIVLSSGRTEHSFATRRYGGKLDFHNDEWICDYKTKPSIIVGKRMAYPEHAQQLAAYAMGLKDGYMVPEAMVKTRRCSNVFVGVEDAQVVFHEWKEKDLLQGWREFECLLNFWWVRNQK